jgi:hypothetical protein
MAPPFRKISTDQLAALVKQYPFARRIDSVLLSQSSLPDRDGTPEMLDLLVRLWRRDIAAGEPDVAWHLAVDPSGGVWLGRDWDLPAGPAGAFTILSLTAEREPARRAAALVQDRFGLRRAAQESAQESMAAPDLPIPDLILGDDGEPPEEGETDGILLGEDETEPPVASSSGSAEEAKNPETDDLILTLLRSGGPVSGAVSTREAVTGQEGVFPEPITPDIKEALRPHVVDLTEGRFSTGGLFETSRDDVDALFGEHLEQAVAGHGAGNPLRLVIWAHGGLVKERAGLLGAHRQILWWKRNGVYPLYFVWETGLLQSIGQLLGGRGGGEEGVFTETVTDFTDKRLEALARAAGGPSIWGVIRRNAHAAVDPGTGGAFYVLAKLADFCRRHPGAVELHAAGHSAGAIFHASLLPSALRQGVPPFKALYLLAPAVRVDLFHERLAPLVGPGKGVGRLAVFTMNKDRELADNCATVYRKSLLYLIHFALEEKRETPILGLEISLRGDPRLKELLGLGGAGSGAAGEVIWSKSPATAGPRSRSRSTSHGGFDEDAATMDSVLRRVLDTDAIPLSFEKAGTLTAELAAAEPAPAPSPDIILGEESPEEDEGVPFTVLDALERATEAAEGIGPQASEPEPESPFFEAVATVDITFGPNAKAADVTDFSRQVLTDILRAAGLSKVIVSSTSRLPADQARVMYANLESQGVAAQLKLYKEPGRKVIEVYRQGKLAGKDAATIKKLMTDEIVRLGPTTVSRHASDPKILNVFDVAPSSVAKRPEFEAAVRAETRVAKFLLPPNDPGYHLEIPQPAAVG